MAAQETEGRGHHAVWISSQEEDKKETLEVILLMGGKESNAAESSLIPETQILQWDTTNEESVTSPRLSPWKRLYHIEQPTTPPPDQKIVLRMMAEQALACEKYKEKVGKLNTPSSPSLQGYLSQPALCLPQHPSHRETTQGSNELPCPCGAASTTTQTPDTSRGKGGCNPNPSPRLCHQEYGTPPEKQFGGPAHWEVVDTGCSITILLPYWYRKMKTVQRPHLTFYQGCFLSRDNSPNNILGRATISVHLEVILSWWQI